MATTKFTLNVPSIGYQKTIELKVLKPFRIDLKANKKDRRDGIFGFDTIPKKRIVETNYEQLKQEYKPLTEKILGKEYIPSWLSIRKGQTVELKLDWAKKRRTKDYETISFDEHKDFTFEPKNLKDAKMVKITCNNTSETSAQILIKANDKLVVGALNIFYRKPKKVNINWVIAEFNRDDIINLEKKYNKKILVEYLKKAFSPALIDIEVLNELPHKINIPILEQRNSLSDKDKIIKHHIVKMRNHMDGTMKVIATETNQKKFLINLYHTIRNSKNITNTKTIILILTNLECSSINTKGLSEYVNGFSLTGKGISVMALGNKENNPPVEIPHEIMHAISLYHTFDISSGFKISKGRTDNYMDYQNTKKHTYKWQWEKLHNSKYSLYEK